MKRKRGDVVVETRELCMHFGGVRAVDEKTLESSAVDLSAFKSLKDMEKALDVDAIKSALGSLGQTFACTGETCEIVDISA